MGRPDGPPYQPPAGDRPPPYQAASHVPIQERTPHHPSGNVPYAATRQQPGSGDAPPYPSSAANPRLERDEEERGAVQGQDETDGAVYRRSTRSNTYGTHNYHRTVSTIDQVTDEVPGLFHSFVMDRMEDDGIPIPEELGRRRRPHVNSDVGLCLRQIGDELNNHTALNSMISQISVNKDTAFGTFAEVAGQIFSDGVINWGRIVALLYFGYKLAIKSLCKMPIIETICGWIVTFIAERLASWIAQRGGWTAIREYFGSTSTQCVVVFCAGLLTGFLVYSLKSSK